MLCSVPPGKYWVQCLKVATNLTYTSVPFNFARAFCHDGPGVA